MRECRPWMMGPGMMMTTANLTSTGRSQWAEVDAAAQDLRAHRCPPAEPDGSPAPRYKPSLNTGGKTLESIEAYFYHFMPEEWIDLIINHTNPFLEGETTPTRSQHVAS